MFKFAGVSSKKSWLLGAAIVGTVAVVLGDCHAAFFRYSQVRQRLAGETFAPKAAQPKPATPERPPPLAGKALAGSTSNDPRSATTAKPAAAELPVQPRSIVQLENSDYVPRIFTIPATAPKNTSLGRANFRFTNPPGPGFLLIDCDRTINIASADRPNERHFEAIWSPGHYLRSNRRPAEVGGETMIATVSGRSDMDAHIIFVEQSKLLDKDRWCIYQVGIPADRWSTLICFPPSPGKWATRPSGPMRYLVNEWFETDDLDRARKERPVAMVRMRSTTNSPEQCLIEFEAAAPR
jgi:hypothetical protein